jgi:Fe-S-cluster containining protein
MGVVAASPEISPERRHFASTLDRGDGTCKNFDDATLLCRIYDTRPFLCRVKEQALVRGDVAGVYTEFLGGCAILQDAAGTPAFMRVNPNAFVEYR